MTVARHGCAFAVAAALAACSVRSVPAVAAPPAVAAAPATAASVAPASSSAPIRFNLADLQWRDAPPTMPAGSKIAVLEGDPRKPAFFTMRLQLPPGARLNPHTHPADERATVISGTVHVAFGEKFDATKGQTLGAGAFYVNPTPMPHFVWTDEGCVLQVTGIGPWGFTYV